MGLTNVIGWLTLSVVLAGYLCYVMIPIPADIDHKDAVFWVFAKRKCIQGMSIAGESLGFGSQVQLARWLTSSSMLSLHIAADYTGVKVQDATFDGIGVRIIQPAVRTTETPALIWLHGGGWIIGSAKSDDYLTTELSRKLGILVISVDYRLAPEYPFPIPFDDCVRATVHFLNHAKEMGVDATRVAIAGESAGANLAAAVSLRLRDIGHVPRPTIQVLFVPCLQAFDMNTPSYQFEANNAYLPRHWMANYLLWYARGVDAHKFGNLLTENEHTSAAAKTSSVSRLVDHSLIPNKYIDPSYAPNTVNHGNEMIWNQLEPIFLDPYFAPLMAASLGNLPAAYVVTAEHDALRDDGLMFARRLSNDGVPVVHRHYDHGYHSLFADFSHSNVAFNDLVQFLSTHL